MAEGPGEASGGDLSGRAEALREDLDRFRF